MPATLDGQVLFDQQVRIEPQSFAHDAMEKAVPGLDGVLSIHLGRRSRKIKQRGTLRAKSRTELHKKIDAISACMDGRAHTLMVEGGQQYGNLRMDVFRITSERISGAGVVADYEIVYKQLRA
jgi:hypothetical protein